jgi:hypothetical protein
VKSQAIKIADVLPTSTGTATNCAAEPLPSWPS